MTKRLIDYAEKHASICFENDAISPILYKEYGVNYPPSALTLRGGGFVPLTRTQGRHMPAVPFDRDYVSSIPGLRGGRP